MYNFRKKIKCQTNLSNDEVAVQNRSACGFDGAYMERRKQNWLDTSKLDVSPLVKKSEKSSSKRRGSNLNVRELDVYKVNANTREWEKSLVLPNIVKSTDDSSKREENKEYNDCLSPENKKIISSNVSLRSIRSGKRRNYRNTKNNPVRKSKLTKQAKDTITLETIRTKTIKGEIDDMKKKKCNFIRFERGGSVEHRAKNFSKSQTRKPTLTYLSPDHYEVLGRCGKDTYKNSNSAYKSKDNCMFKVMRQQKMPLKNTVIAAKNLRNNLEAGSASALVINGKTAPGQQNNSQYKLYI